MPKLRALGVLFAAGGHCVSIRGRISKTVPAMYFGPANQYCVPVPLLRRP